jgi:hypothetical protein
VDKASLLRRSRTRRSRSNWASTASVDLVRGNLAALRASGGNYTGTVSSCLANNVTASGVADGSNPARWSDVLPRPAHRRRVLQSDPGYTTNHPRESPGRDAEIGADGNAARSGRRPHGGLRNRCPEVPPAVRGPLCRLTGWREGVMRRLLGVVLAAVTSLLAADARPRSSEEAQGSDRQARDPRGLLRRQRQALPGRARPSTTASRSSSTVSPNVNGYGIGVDDMFISWKETRLDEDTTKLARASAPTSSLRPAPSLTSRRGFVELTLPTSQPYDTPSTQRTTATGMAAYADAVDDRTATTTERRTSRCA